MSESYGERELHESLVAASTKREGRGRAGGNDGGGGGIGDGGIDTGGSGKEKAWVE